MFMHMLCYGLWYGVLCRALLCYARRDEPTCEPEEEHAAAARRSRCHWPAVLADFASVHALAAFMSGTSEVRPARVDTRNLPIPRLVPACAPAPCDVRVSPQAAFMLFAAHDAPPRIVRAAVKPSGAVGPAEVYSYHHDQE